MITLASCVELEITEIDELKVKNLNVTEYFLREEIDLTNVQVEAYKDEQLLETVGLSDVVYTLIFITLLFVSLWSIDYLIRYYVKVVNLKHFEKAAVKIENYLLSLLPFIRVPGLITKWRMIESGRKTIWDNLSGVLLDLLVFVFILLILFVLLGYFTFFLVLF